MSVCIVTFADHPNVPYMAVGTTIVLDDDNAARHGRLILFRYKNSQATMITEYELKSAPYRMVPFQEKLLVAIGNSV